MCIRVAYCGGQRAASGELEGESPARLVFLKSVMTSLPFQDMVPSPELVANGSALAKPGEAYLIRIVWGGKEFAQSPRVQVRLAGADLFKVELIDPWRMKVYPLGYTESGDQAFSLPMLTALLRVTAAKQGEGSPLPINTLVAKFAGEPATKMSADPALFKAEPLHYSLDFAIYQLQQSAAANAVLEKYLPPSAPHRGVITVLPLERLPDVYPKLSPDLMQAMQTDLQKIPVE